MQNCLIFFVGEYSSVWPEIYRVLSQIQWRFLRGISGKNYFGRIFQKFCANQGYPLPKLLKFRPTFWNFILGPYCAEKIHTSTFICCLHPGKEARPLKNHRKKIWGRKARTFCFWKTSFVHSRSGTYYALLLGYFGLKFLPDIRHCVYWVLAETWVPDSSHKIGNKFFIHHCQGWKEGSFVCESVWIFSWVNAHPFDPKFVAFRPIFSGDSYVEFQEKNYFGRIFQKFCANQRLSLPKLVKFRPTFCNFILGPYCAVKIHTSTFICCLHPGKETRP